MKRGPALSRLELANVSYWAAFKVTPSLGVVAIALGRWGLGWLRGVGALFLGTATFLLLGALGERVLPLWRRLFDP